MSAFTDSLSSFARKVKTQFPKLNWGGCCVFAAMVGEQLEVYVPVRIRVCSWCGGDVDDARNNLCDNTIEEWNENGIHFNHVIVEFDYDGMTYHYDSCGLVHASPYAYMNDIYEVNDGFLTVNEARELAQQTGWNREFNRSDIPALQRKVDKFFSKLKETCYV